MLPAHDDFILKERKKWENDCYYENFVKVTKWREKQERDENVWTRKQRAVRKS
jgi:hypothetical protein